MNKTTSNVIQFTPNTFSKLPYGEKCRVDELDTAIATLVNLPSAKPEILACGEGKLNVTDTNVGDMISRQAAIDATWEEPTYNDPLNVLTEVRDRIKGLPSAQTKIIRCKDCKHRPVDSEDTQGFGVKFPDEKCPCQCYEDGWYNWRPDDEWFCANAERREG